MLPVKHLIIGDGILGIEIARRLRETDPDDYLLVAPTKCGKSQSRMCQGVIHEGVKPALEGKTGDWRTYANDWLSGSPLPLPMHIMRIVDRTLAELPGRYADVDPTQPPHRGAGAFAAGEVVMDVGRYMDQQLAETSYVRATVRSFAPYHRGRMFASLHVDDAYTLWVEASHIYFVAGGGNVELYRLALGDDAAASLTERVIRRPMALCRVTHRRLRPCASYLTDYGHLRAVVTSVERGGNWIWSVGGPLGELPEGYAAHAVGAVEASIRTELNTFFTMPQDTKVEAVPVVRYEMEGSRQDGCTGPVFFSRGCVSVGWPTKLVMARRLAKMMIADQTE